MIRASARVLLAGLFVSLISVAGAAASPSNGLGDREVKELLLKQSSDRCHVFKDSYGATVQGMDVSLARSVLDHNVLMCPDPALDAAFAVVWYGNHRAITWNPDKPGSAAVLSQVIRHMAQTGDFSDDLQVFDGHGAIVKGQIVPAFTTRCVSQKDCN